MKAIIRFLAMFLFACLLVGQATRLHAQKTDSSPAAQQGKAWTAHSEHMDEPETSSDVEQYRHSAAVKAIARFAHIRTETAAQIFEDFNSAVLLIAIGVFLWKFLPKMLRNRSERLQKELIAARLATEDANHRLAEVEARLLRLDTEIDAIRHQVEQESVEDEKRIHATLELERERIIASAEQEIAAAQATAQRGLKKFAADLAIDHAMRKIQLSNDTDRALVREFGKSLNKNSGGEA